MGLWASLLVKWEPLQFFLPCAFASLTSHREWLAAQETVKAPDFVLRALTLFHIAQLDWHQYAALTFWIMPCSLQCTLTHVFLFNNYWESWKCLWFQEIPALLLHAWYLSHSSWWLSYHWGYSLLYWLSPNYQHFHFFPAKPGFKESHREFQTLFLFLSSWRWPACPGPLPSACPCIEEQSMVVLANLGSLLFSVHLESQGPETWMKLNSAASTLPRQVGALITIFFGYHLSLDDWSIPNKDDFPV